MRVLLIILILLLGPAVGVAAALALYVFQKDPKITQSDPAVHADASQKDATASDFLKLNNQFLVPLVSQDYVEGLIALSVSIELEQGTTEKVYAQEPKLRDAFLQVLFDHANMGGFVGQFTVSSNLETLKKALFDAAYAISGSAVKGILITDIARQDL